ncbi:TonB-dependent receptor family protein [Helicobacter cetorum]|uniref:TonB-dependent receptor family protein n=1 Tax=Helicobacter cetorum TaxID=138563 RepID=UPI003AEF837C
MILKKALKYFSVSLALMVSSNGILLAKSKDYTLGKIKATGQKDNLSGFVNTSYNGLTAPQSWQDEEVKKFSGSRTVISNKQLMQTANQSIEEALQNVPGMQIRNTSGIGVLPVIQVRGFGAGGSGHSNAAQILVNGIPIYIGPYAQIGLPVFPVTFQSVDRIDVIKGGSSVQYGPNTFGGVINIITKPITDKWVNEAAERITFWNKAQNKDWVDKNAHPINNSLENNMLYNTYVKTGGKIGKHFGIMAQANWVRGQGFRINQPTSISNYMLDGEYDINENNDIKAYYQYYDFNMSTPGSLDWASYEENRFANNRPYNKKSGRAKRFGIVYTNRFGDIDKVGGIFTFTYYTQDMTRNFQIDSNYNSSNTHLCLEGVACPFGGNMYPYTSNTYNGFTLDQNPRRVVFNAFEPKLNLVVNTGKIKQTFIMGMRYFTTDMYAKNFRNTLSCNNENASWCDNGGVNPQVYEGSAPGMSGWYDKKNHYRRWNNDYVAAYISDKIEMFDSKLSITPGVRYTFMQYHYTGDKSWGYEPPKIDLQKISNMNVWNPSVNIDYTAYEDNKHTMFTYFTYQRSFLPPQLNVISVGNVTNEYFTQHFDQVEVGARYSYKNKFSFNADYYRIWARDYATGQYAIYTSGPNKGNIRPVNGYSQGVELEAYYHPIRGLQFHAAFNYIDTRVTSHFALTDLAGDSLKGTSYNKMFPFVSPYQFIFDARYTYKRTTFGLSSYFYSRAYSNIGNTVERNTYWDLGGNNINGGGAGCGAWCMTVSRGELPWYWVWNIEVSQVFWENGRHRVYGSLQVNNLFNMQYYFIGIGSSPSGFQSAPGRSVTAYLSYQF